MCETAVRRFLPRGSPRRRGAKCPLCGSLERHRLAWLFLARSTNLLDGTPKRLLHIAPEPAVQAHLQATPGIDYLSADLDSPQAMVSMDIQEIAYPDESFDVIVCSHVLEHVPDDKRAMRALRRVLSGGGWAVLNVPITASATVEDPSVTDPAERKRSFGQSDHVRRYGPDYADRLRHAGFAVEVVTAADLVGAADRARFGIDTRAAGEVYWCRNAAP